MPPPQRESTARAWPGTDASGPDPILPKPSIPPILLADLPRGARAVVESVDLGDAVGQRLVDLGFVPGTPVAMVRRAPLGDPSVYELRGTRLCLRRREAARVRVRPLDADAPRP